MKIKQAIEQVVQNFGAEILKESRLIGLLSDYEAFDDIDPAKNILRQVYQKGYGVQIYNAYSARDIMQINAVKKTIVDRLGCDSKILTEIFNGFNLAFGLQPMVEEVNGTISNYDKIKIVNTRIVNCDGTGREIKKSTFSTNEIRYLTPKVNIVSSYDSDRTIDFTIKITNKGKTYSYSCQANIKSGQSENMLLQGYGNENGYFFSPGECSFEIYLDGKILSQKGINISKPKLTEEKKDNRETIIKAVALAIAILLNIPTYFVSGWWLIMTGICTLSFGLTLFDNKWEERKKWMNFACLITIFITIFTPLPWWLLLIELVGFCFTTNH
jgi:hypothetical protein